MIKLLCTSMVPSCHASCLIVKDGYIALYEFVSKEILRNVKRRENIQHVLCLSKNT